MPLSPATMRAGLPQVEQLRALSKADTVSSVCAAGLGSPVGFFDLVTLC